MAWMRFLRTGLLGLVVVLVASSASAQVGAPSAKVTASVEPLAPEVGAQAVATITVEIPPGHHAQSHRPLDESLIAFEVQVVASGATVGEIAYPDGHVKNYAQLGEASVYSGTIQLKVPLTITASPATAQAEVTYQICNEEGTCFAPETKMVSLLGDATSPQQPSGTKAPTSPGPTPQTVSLFGYSVSLTNFAVAIPVALVVGLLFNIMPCVLPVLPLKAMGFYEASQHHRSRSLAFGASFSLGLIAVFALLATFVIVSRLVLGRHFQWGEWFAYGPFVYGMGGLLLVLGAGMLGAFSINLPSSVYGLSFRHDTLTGNFLWGILTAVLSTPCTAPMFAGLMTFSIGQPVALGVLVMLTVGVGMALPYLLLSAFPEAARSFPRTGPGAELIKQALAFPLIGTAVWLVGPRFVEDPAHWWLVLGVAVWGALFILIRAAQMLTSAASLLVTTGLAVLTVAGVLAVTLQFNTKPATVAGAQQPAELWTKYSDQSLTAALQTGQPVIVKFTASWCANCQVVEATVFRNAQVLGRLSKQNAILIKADLTQGSAPGWPKLNELGFTGIPLTAVYRPGADKPVLLDSIYTADDLFAALEPESEVTKR